jgi:predicted nucleic acid-binding protein
MAAGSEMIITGDDDLLRLGSFQGIKIRKPADFLAGFQARTR